VVSVTLARAQAFRWERANQFSRLAYSSPPCIQGPRPHYLTSGEKLDPQYG
jgi:hypothetical protein